MFSVLLRFLFPAWRFFEDFSEYPVLQYRHRLEDSEWSEWKQPSYINRRQIHHLFLNPQDNLQMAFNSLLEKLLANIEATKRDGDIEKTDSFARIKRWVILLLENQKYDAFQFQVLIRSVPENEDHLVLSSRVYEV